MAGQTVILGINAHHADAAACVVVDGGVVAASEEERHRRVKHFAGFPSAAVKACLRQAGLSIGDVDHVAVNRDPRANRLRKAVDLARHPGRTTAVPAILARRRRAESVLDELSRVFGDRPVEATPHHVEHHRAHLASAFFVSPFQDAAVASVDGFGDYTSAMWGVGHGSSLDVVDQVRFPHSLGHYYLAMTQYLGFPAFGDEYKVMGLAAYGRPRYAPALREVVRLADHGRFELGLDYFRHHRRDLPMTVDPRGAPRFEAHYSDALVDLLGPARAPGADVEERHRDIAASAQVVYAEALFHLLRHVRTESGKKDLCLAGGCAMNSLANGRIPRETGFERVFVQPAAGDAGGALGAAQWVWNVVLGGRRGPELTDAGLGPDYTADEQWSALEGERVGASRVTTFDDEAELCRFVAERIDAGDVVGWYQGRAEWGPRALGNRSILADPRRADMREVLNVRIKRREPFRPFAPSVLREEAPDWFEGGVDVPFMTHVLPVRKERRAAIPAVTHVDGTARVQTVTAEQNPRYHRLIEAFFARTGVPMLLNTSFNESEPIVESPRDAIACFMRTRMDLLVLGDHVVQRVGRSVEGPRRDQPAPASNPERCPEPTSPRR